MANNVEKYTQYVELSGTQKVIPKAQNLGAADLSEIFDVTIRIFRKSSIEEALQQEVRLTRDEYEREFGITDDAVEKIEDFARNFNLAIVLVDKSRRSVVLKGRLVDFEHAFNTRLSAFKDGDGNSFRGRSGSINIPKELEGIVEGVFGLDNRPHASPKHKALQHDGVFLPHTASIGFTSNEISSIYKFPADVNGAGQCIALIELGGGYRIIDLNKYFADLKLPSPTIIAVSVNNGHNAPSVPNSADSEVVLDIQVAGAVAPAAKIAVYFAPNTDRGFLDAITTAIHDDIHKPSVISVSWGSAEVNWTQQSPNSMNEAFKAASILGITVCIASGDEGSSDGRLDGRVHVDFPASSPYVLACGGTTLQAQNGNVVSETVWHDSQNSSSGGGISDFFVQPDYQKNASLPTSISKPQFKGRGVPDVAGNADPVTGYKVLVDGQEIVLGGTSAVAPLYAGLIALMNQKNGVYAGFINPG